MFYKSILSLFLLICYSLNNLSGFPGQVRWSLDLRWQDPRLPWNFHGLADGITFRKADNPDWRPSEEDWDKFLKISRDEKWRAERDRGGLVAGVSKVSFDKEQQQREVIAICI